MSSETKTTVAILGGNPLVGRVLESLLGGVGYDTRLFEEQDSGKLGDLPLDGVNVLLLAPGLSDDHREALFSRMKSAPKTAAISILALSTALEGTPPDGTELVPWPCRTEDLAQKIEAALRAAGGDEPIAGRPTPAEQPGALYGRDASSERFPKQRGTKPTPVLSLILDGIAFLSRAK